MLQRYQGANLLFQLTSRLSALTQDIVAFSWLAPIDRNPFGPARALDCLTFYPTGRMPIVGQVTLVGAPSFMGPTS